MQKTSTTRKISRVQISAIEEAEYKIRNAVKNAIFSFESENVLKHKIATIIKKAVSKNTIPDLARAVARSLEHFYQRERQYSYKIGRKRALFFLSLAKLAGNAGTYTKNISDRRAREIVSGEAGATLMIPDSVILQRGNALQMYHKNYFKRHVEPILDKMASEQALDPESTQILGRNTTLRSRAEREARHEGHLANINRLKDQGAKLVMISVHADCSERCRAFQGKVFSLDGTSGRTEDGISYEPIENATDIYTKDGKWKNGLFGFNCRHYAVEYKTGFRFPKQSSASERKQYALTQKQREMERNVRKWRIKAEMKKNVDRETYKKARKKAIEWNEKYIAFSRENNIAYYPDRVKLL